MRRIFSSLVIMVMVSALAVSATRAYFSDTETSSGNRITAGTLDLNLDGTNENSVKFPDVSILPDQTVSGTWTVHNTGSIAGYLDLHKISKRSDEYGCVEPEISAGDTTCDNPGESQGELLDLLNIHIFVDADNDGTYDTGETNIFEGLANGLASDYDQNISLTSDETTYITMLVNWPSSSPDTDIKAQGDTFDLGMTFELAQTQAQ